MTKVLENERFEWKGQSGTNEEKLLVMSSITPENPLGNVFKIEVSWEIANTGDSQCRARAEGTVECTAKAWGLQRVAEGVLQSQSEQSLRQWLEAGAGRVEQFLMEECNERNQSSEEEPKHSHSNGRLNTITPLDGIRMRSGLESPSVDKAVYRGMDSGKAKVSDDEVEELDSFAVHVESNEELLRSLSSSICVNSRERYEEEPDFPWVMLGWLLLVSTAGVVFWVLNYKSMI